MWYDQAQYVVLGATAMGTIAAWAVTARRRWRALPLMVIAFGLGLYVGIGWTAGGAFKLPLGPMQAQLHAVWGIAESNLEPPRE